MVRIIDLIFLVVYIPTPEFKKLVFQHLIYFFKYWFTVMITKPQLLTAVAFGIKRVLSNLNKKLVLAYTLLNSLSPKPVLQLLGFERKKNLIFKLEIN